MLSPRPLLLATGAGLIVLSMGMLILALTLGTDAEVPVLTSFAAVCYAGWIPTGVVALIALAVGMTRPRK